MGPIAAGESFYWLHELFANAGDEMIPFIVAVLTYIGNELVENPEELMISSGPDGYYPALQPTRNKCRHCG